MGLEKAAIVVVTYKRQELLQVLFDSLIALEKPIWRVVIVDNENSPQTKEMVDAWNELAQAQWGLPSADAEGGTTRYHISDWSFFSRTLTLICCDCGRTSPSVCTHMGTETRASRDEVLIGVM